MDLEAVELRGLLGSVMVSPPPHQYRYTLERRGLCSRTDHAGRKQLRRLVVVGLNPSVANHLVDDPTIRRCRSFAVREKCGALTMLNLFAWVSTDPFGLYGIVDPVGREHDVLFLAALARRVDETEDPLIVCAWGIDGERWASRVVQVSKMLEIAAVPPMCFGYTRSGQPRHPSRLPNDQPLELWRAHT